MKIREEIAFKISLFIPHEHSMDVREVLSGTGAARTELRISYPLGYELVDLFAKLYETDIEFRFSCKLKGYTEITFASVDIHRLLAMLDPHEKTAPDNMHKTIPTLDKDKPVILVKQK